MSERERCTKERPYTEGAPGPWAHPDAKCVDEEYNGLAGGGDYASYECPNCGIRFRVTFPD